MCVTTSTHSHAHPFVSQIQFSEHVKCHVSIVCFALFFFSSNYVYCYYSFVLQRNTLWMQWIEVSYSNHTHKHDIVALFLRVYEYSFQATPAVLFLPHANKNQGSKVICICNCANSLFRHKWNEIRWINRCGKVQYFEDIHLCTYLQSDYLRVSMASVSSAICVWTMST